MGGLGLLGLYRWQWHHYRRFQEVRPGVLYRTGMPSEWGLRHLVQQYGIRTVLCLYEVPVPRVRAGWFFDPGGPSGPPESQLAHQLGVRFFHWIIPLEGPWPWPDPEHLEEFFHLMDQPENWPVLIHCWAGKHRTGTFVALYRLEYEDWPVAEALKEMYRFQFGASFALQEHNLRTYVRRPRPTASQWHALQEAFSPYLSRQPADYDDLVRMLRAEMARPAVAARLEEYLRQGKPFGVCLADRLMGTKVPWLPALLLQADRILFLPSQESFPKGNPKEMADSTSLSTPVLAEDFGQLCRLPNRPPRAEEVATAAGLVADFGYPEAQRRLWSLLEQQIQQPEITPRYRALVAGLINRYRPSRLPYLKLLLEDRRVRPEPVAAGTRYADTAVARMAAIVQEDFIGRRGQASSQDWDQAILRAKQWFAQHPEAAKLP